MEAKKFLFDDEARTKLLEGALIIYKAVASTLGPRGRTVMIDRYPDAPRSTKDGVTVAKEVILSDVFANMGAQMIKEAAKQASDEAGDGTTTATILAVQMLQEGMRALSTGGNPSEITKGMQLAVGQVLEFYERLSTPVRGKEQVAQVGACAANQDRDIGEKIADAMDRVGKDGMVSVEEGSGVVTEVETLPGVRIDSGYLDPRFMTERNGRVEFDDVVIVLVDKKINVGKAVLPILEWQNRVKPPAPVLLIASDCTGTALQTLIGNKVKFGLPVVAVKAPLWGTTQKEFFEDLAVMTGAKVFGAESGLDIASIKIDAANLEKEGKNFGRAKRVVVDRDSCVIITPGGDKEKIEKRAAMLRGLLDEGKLSPYDAEKVQSRLAKMTGGIANISVGAHTEVELKELKDRVEDALNACRAAVEEGVLAGGGIVPFYAQMELDKFLAEGEFPGDVALGVRIVRNALEAPITVLAENANKKPGEVTATLKRNQEDAVKNGMTDFEFGWNAATDTYGSMLKMGVLVPKKVERVALEKAFSVVSVILSTAVVMANSDEREKDELPVM